MAPPQAGGAKAVPDPADAAAMDPRLPLGVRELWREAR